MTHLSEIIAEEQKEFEKKFCKKYTLVLKSEDPKEIKKEEMHRKIINDPSGMIDVLDFLSQSITRAAVALREGTEVGMKPACSHFGHTDGESVDCDKNTYFNSALSEVSRKWDAAGVPKTEKV